MLPNTQQQAALIVCPFCMAAPCHTPEYCAELRLLPQFVGKTFEEIAFGDPPDFTLEVNKKEVPPC